MTYRLHLIIICLFLLSCASQKAKHRSRSQEKITQDICTALSLPLENVKSKTGVCTLESGGEGLVARLWLTEHAQKTIDLQYFSFAKDVTGLIACDYIIRAADRGVKIRILIDDAASKMYSYEVKLLESHENIEIHVYNAGLRLGRPDKRMTKFARNINRLLRRMHNKTFTVDGKITLIGGRNISDEYFDYDKKYNFRDRDVLLAGAVVPEIQSSFEKFWSDPLTIPYSQLSRKIKKKRYQDSLRFEHIHKKAATTKKFSNDTRARVDSFPLKIKKALDLKSFSWVENANFISDKPGKNSEKENRIGGIATDSIASLIRGAKNTIIINTPYFIPTPGLKQLLHEALQRGVKIRLITNSLASTDQPAAFSAYKKTRMEYVQAGIELHEFKPKPAERFELLLPDIQKKRNYKSVFGFHSKTLLIDNHTLIIGSYNLDQRSADYNTECITVLRSDVAAQNLSGHMEKEFSPENSWQITEKDNPDSRAPLARRIKAFLLNLVPKKLL